MNNKEQLFIVLNNIHTDEILKSQLTTLVNNESYYIELNEKLLNINNKILEKRNKLPNSYNKNEPPTRFNSYGNSNHKNNNYNYNSNSNPQNQKNYRNHTTNNIRPNRTNKYDTDYKTKLNINRTNPLNITNKITRNNENGQHGQHGQNNYKNNNYKKDNNVLNKYTNENVFLTLNSNLNKLSINNFDAIMGSNLECIAMYIINEINDYIDNYNKFFVKFKGDENMIEKFNYKKLFTDFISHINYIFTVCVKKTLIQLDQYKLYFKYIHTIHNVKVLNYRASIIYKLTEKVNSLILCNNTNKEANTLDDNEMKEINNKLLLKLEEFKNEVNTNIVFDKTIGDFKTEIKELSILFLKNKDLDDDITSLNLISKFNELVMIKNTNINFELKNYKNEVIFNFLGYFNKYFGNFNAGNNSTFNEYLLAIYENFKNINELLMWDSINNIELENRIYFVIGFLDDNNKFIKTLDYDFFQDIESELETIKKSKTIPTNVKYKLLDTIDNFIQSRFDKT